MRSFITSEIEIHWTRLVAQEKVAAEAFPSMIVVGLEIVQLKLALKHGQFSQGMAQYLPNCSERTIRNYRRVGEWYLSVTHMQIMTVRAMHEKNVRPKEEFCSDDAVRDYLKDGKIRNSEDLRADAAKKMPKLFKVNPTQKNTQAKAEMEHVRRNWAKMNHAQKTEFLDELTKFLTEHLSKKTASVGASDEAEIHAEHQTTENISEGKTE